MTISEEIIDLYIKGELSESQLDSFNKAIASDPNLQKEVDLQSDIINSIKQYRHQQLKSRFNSIEIPAASPSNSVYWKFAASLAFVAALIGGTSILVNNQNSTNTSDLKQVNSLETVTSHNHINTTENTSSIAPFLNDDPNNTNNNSTVSLNSKNKSGKASKPTIKSNTATIDNPSTTSEEEMVMDSNPDRMNGDFEVPSINDGNSNSGIQNIRVNIIKEKELAYRFYNNQLYLHGNFGKSPYELYELNTSPEKRLYLYFESNYYELIQGKTKITSLTPIKDKASIDQLDQLRER